MVTVARQRTPEVLFEVGSMLALDADDETWGGIVALYSIVHLDDDELRRALSELHRVLVAGGLLLLAFHVTVPPGMEVNGDRIHVEQFLGHEVSFDARIFDPDSVTAELERAGLVVEASVVRRPYPEIEEPTRRAYLLARRPDHTQTG